MHSCFLKNDRDAFVKGSFLREAGSHVAQVKLRENRPCLDALKSCFVVPLQEFQDLTAAVDNVY